MKLGLFALLTIGLAMAACAQAPCGSAAPAATPAPAEAVAAPVEAAVEAAVDAVAPAVEAAEPEIGEDADEPGVLFFIMTAAAVLITVAVIAMQSLALRSFGQY